MGDGAQGGDQESLNLHVGVSSRRVPVSDRRLANDVERHERHVAPPPRSRESLRCKAGVTTGPPGG